MAYVRTDQIALLDLDGTVADYDGRLREKMEAIRGPEEPPYVDRYTRIQRGYYHRYPENPERPAPVDPAFQTFIPDDKEPPHCEARRKIIQAQPGFWRGLERIKLGFDIVAELREIGFLIHVLTKGPAGTSSAWSEKVDWCREHLPGALMNISSDKSLTYGKVLVDDWPEYFLGWAQARPRGLVVCVAQPWNDDYRDIGPKAHPNVFRYDGSQPAELRRRLKLAFDRKPGEQ